MTICATLEYIRQMKINSHSEDEIQVPTQHEMSKFQTYQRKTNMEVSELSEENQE